MARSADLEFNRPCSFLPRGRVLLVDEDGNDLRYYTALLWRLGYVVRPFASYQEAETCLQREPIDFILVNQGSPAFESRVLVEHALERNRRTPVAVLTHSLHMGCYLEAMQLGAVDYLEKPLAPAEVEHLVTTHVQPRPSERRGQTT
jgi:two-component system response regulator FlrC